MNTQPQTGLNLREHVLLAPYTTLRIGGPARYFAEVHSEDELLAAVRFAREHGLPVFVLGGGSNLLVADAGFPGLVIHLCLGGDIAWTADRSYVEASAGLGWDAFTRIVCEQGISGIECLAGIPGLVGASPIQNIGAYGQEVASTIASLRALDLTSLQYVELPASACAFAYRTSIFNSTQRDRYIVTRVDFQFSPAARPNLSYADLARHFGSQPGTNPSPLDVYHAVRAIRDRKGMIIDPSNPQADTHSAGSFFKNPVVIGQVYEAIAASTAQPVPHWPTGDAQVKLAAAWLIEQAGFPKGFSETPASTVGISTRHTLALINRTGTATCAELLHLRDTIVAGVQDRFHVNLDQEPVYLSAVLSGKELS